MGIYYLVFYQSYLSQSSLYQSSLYQSCLYDGNTCCFSSPDNIHGRNKKQRDFGRAVCEMRPHFSKCCMPRELGIQLRLIIGISFI